MAQTAADLRAYHQAPDHERRAQRKRILAELEAQQARDDQIRKACEQISFENRLAGVRADLEAFQRGDEELMGTPRHLVNFDRAYSALEWTLARGER